MSKEIPIFFAADDGYAPLLAVALNSAVKNADKNRNYRAVILQDGITEENRRKLKSLASDNFKIDIMSMKQNFDMLDDRMCNRLRCDYFTLTIYFRLFIPAMFTEYDKAIYIDSDVVIADDIAKLYDIDIGDNFLGACNDLSIADVPPLVAYTENAVGVKKHEYINSGVLLMNLKKLREAGFEEHFLHLLNTYHFDSIAPDQDYINAICNGKIHYLDKSFDAMPNNARPVCENPVIIHYNLFEKPWCYDGIQYDKEFWHYAEDCGFIDEIKEHKENYTDEQRKADKECLELLINNGIKIPENEITFKKLYESGVKIRL
ncbi:MAG: glycosyltransferase family 8 protein [Clostridia bacterium]|nr:glycosyltransferase family 8 protein [Clostridia bacterium]